MKYRNLIVAFAALAATGSLLLLAKPEKPEPSGHKMAAAANDFLKTLTAEQGRQASFPFAAAERLNWHFIPRERKGLPLKDLEGDALKAAHKLIASGLSSAGYDQAVDVMSLEEVLYLLEGGERETRRSRRDPQKYYISIFGTPSNKGTWGWRVEGHHLSLNYTIVNGEVVSSTPEFFGANPALVDAGPKRKIRVLAAEEDLARQILKLCTAEQQKSAWLSKEAPDDIRGGGKAQPVLSRAVGLRYADMSADQKKLLRDLLTEYLKNMPADIEAKRRAAIDKAGIENIAFAWWGSEKPNKRHAYRVQGPSFIIEYNNTQNDANHLHTIWRDTSGDFNVPLEK